MEPSDNLKKHAEALKRQGLLSLGSEGGDVLDIEESERQPGLIRPFGARVTVEVLVDKEVQDPIFQSGPGFVRVVQGTDYCVGMIIEVGGPTAWDDDEKLEHMSLRKGDTIYYPKGAETKIGDTTLVAMQAIVAFEREEL